MNCATLELEMVKHTPKILWMETRLYLSRKITLDHCTHSIRRLATADHHTTELLRGVGHIPGEFKQVRQAPDWPVAALFWSGESACQ